MTIWWEEIPVEKVAEWCGTVERSKWTAGDLGGEKEMLQVGSESEKQSISS